MVKINIKSKMKDFFRVDKNISHKEQDIERMKQNPIEYKIEQGIKDSLHKLKTFPFADDKYYLVSIKFRETPPNAKLILDENTYNAWLLELENRVGKSIPRDIKQFCTFDGVFELVVKESEKEIIEIEYYNN
jgi:hypothetical protein